MSDLDCDLLVVGLGPVGDTLAGLAKLQGLSVIAIEREGDVYPLPRAAVFDDEVMRVFQMLGVAERIALLCRVPDRYQFVTARSEILLDFPVDRITTSGWAGTYALHQPAVERVLRDRLIDLGVDVRFRTRFTQLTQDANGVRVGIEGESGAGVIRARYVVGCDGAWSPVRDALRVGVYDYEFDEPWLVLDTIVEEPGDLPIVCQQICDPRRPVTYIAMSSKRFRWEFMLKPDESAEEMLSSQRIAALLAPWGCADRAVIERKAVYRFHGLVANRWRVGRVMIAGDAAHQMPPFAGQGMSSGLRDAANLAWKLAMVVWGEADAAILESYQAEREPHVRAIIETAIAMGRVVCLLDQDAATARDANMLARRRSGAQDVSLNYPDLRGGMLMATPAAGALFLQPVIDGRRFDDFLGHGSALVGRDLPGLVDPTVRLCDLSDRSLAAFAPVLGAWLERIGARAALIRPDRHVFGTGAARDLLAAWRAELRVPETA